MTDRPSERITFFRISGNGWQGKFLSGESDNFHFLAFVTKASKEAGDMESGARGGPARPSTTVLRVGIDRATMRGRWIGTQLRAHREAADVKGAEIAKRIGRSGGTISKWESGDLIPRPAEMYYMLEIYGVRDEERDTLMRRAEEARQPGVSEVDVSVSTADHIWLESRAWRIETFQTVLVPGLLQTREHAREVLMAWNPTASSDRIDRTIAARELRQRRLTGDDPLELFAILDEAVLRRPVGSAQTARAQLRFLVDRATLPNVDIRVVPFAAGAHAGLTGAFDVLQFRDEGDIVYVETRGGHMYLDRPAPFADAMRRLEEIALSMQDSVAMIDAVAGEIR
jgi:transcriptional regulator with XRE-family HTH domain